MSKKVIIAVVVLLALLFVGWYWYSIIAPGEFETVWAKTVEKEEGVYGLDGYVPFLFGFRIPVRYTLLNELTKKEKEPDETLRKYMVRIQENSARRDWSTTVTIISS
jgi:hypothetical protein